MSPSTAYESSTSTARRVAQHDSETIDYPELVRLASLAASSHNTQPWTFAVGDDVIRIHPDFSRRCPVVDPEDAHLFKSLGCAAENLVQAAAAAGLRAEVDDAHESGVTVRLVRDPACHDTDLARAIPARQCTKGAYDGRPLDPPVIDALERAGSGDGVRTIVLTATDEMRAVTDFVNRGNQVQLSDPAFREELISWIRPNDRESLATGDGLSGRTSGAPSVPSWLAKWLLPLLVTAKRQRRTDEVSIASSAGVAVFVTDHNDTAAWVAVGRCYERFALQATALEIRNAFINQPIEVSSVRPELEQWLGLDGEHAQLMVRFGTGTHMPYSIRRPLDEVMVVSDS